MDQPFFSIIIPIYNVGNYLVECVDSVLAQSFQNIEVILINDGSTDNSLDICNEYQLNDSRIKVIDKTNEGLAETRNKGLELSRGKYIIFLDGDDYLERTGTALSKIYSILSLKKIDVLLFNLTSFNIDSNSLCNIHNVKNIKNIKATDDLDYIFRRRVYLASACNKIVRKEIISQNSLRFPKGLLSEDIKWCGDLLKYTDRITFYPIDFYYYRKGREGSITYKTSKKNLVDIAEQITNHHNFLSEKTHFNKKYIDEYYSFYYLSCLKQMCEHDDFNYKEIVTLLDPVKSYLSMSYEKRIVLVRTVVKVLGLKNVVILSKLFYNYRKT